MKIKTIINEKYDEIELHVCHHEATSQVTDLVSTLDGFLNQSYPVRKENGDRVIISPSDILSVFAQKGRVYVMTQKQGLCETSLSLSAMEEKLGNETFFRVSRSELINLSKIIRLDMNLAGTIKVILEGGYECYTSRRNVSHLKQALGL